MRKAPDGLAVKRAIESEVPDLILLDLRMSKMDGFALLEVKPVSSRILRARVRAMLRRLSRGLDIA